MNPSWQIARDSLVQFLDKPNSSIEFAWAVLQKVVGMYQLESGAMFMALPSCTREAMRQYLVELT